jgi:hypothetical protein
MTWLVWRLQRLELILTAGFLALLSAYLVATGLPIVSVYHELGPSCASAGADSSACDLLNQAIGGRAASVIDLFSWMRLLPLGFAVMFAVPILLQVEQGTYRMVWTQSETKERWLGVMLSSAVLATIAAAAIFSALASWWRQPVDFVQGVWQTGFDVEGVVAIAYSLFALALLLAAGVFLRRSLPAVGITFAGFLLARYTITAWLRPSYLPPLHGTWRFGSPKTWYGARPHAPYDWFLAMGQGNRSGTITPQDVINRTCPPRVSSNGITNAITPCLQHHHWTYNVFIFQPASRFWPFQIIESAIYFGMAAVLLSLTIWWVRTRLA